MRRLFLTVAVTLFASNAVGASTEDAEDIIRQIETPRDIPARFLERRNNRMLSVPLELSGEMILSSSGKFSKMIYAPIREIVTISEIQITQERNGRTRSVPIHRISGVSEFYRGLRALLEGDLITVSELFEVVATDSETGWAIEMMPKSRKLRAFLQVMSVSGTDNRVTWIRTVQSEDDWQELSFYPEGIE